MNPVKFLFLGGSRSEFNFNPKEPFKSTGSTEVDPGKASNEFGISAENPFGLRSFSSVNTHFALYYPKIFGLTQKRIFRFYTSDEQKERIEYWEKMKSTMRNIQMASAAGSFASFLIGYSLSGYRLLNTAGKVALLVAGVGLAILSMWADSRDVEAWKNQITSWERVPLNEEDLKSYYTQLRV